jgi:hypothetical protein
MHVVGSWSNHYFFLKLTSMSHLVYAGGQSYTQEISRPILRYDVRPTQHRNTHVEQQWTEDFKVGYFQPKENIDV